MTHLNVGLEEKLTDQAKFLHLSSNFFIKIWIGDNYNIGLVRNNKFQVTQLNVGLESCFLLSDNPCIINLPAAPVTGSPLLSDKLKGIIKFKTHTYV